MASIKEKIGYALGDAASGGITWKIMSTAFPLFFTHVFGLTFADAAALMLVARMFDVVTDPLMGSLADRTQSRWGTYRPWLIFGAIPYGLIFALLLFTPDLGPTGKRIWAYTLYLMMMAVYTMVNVPYGSLLGVMTEDDDEKNQFSSYRMVGAYAMGFVTLISFPYLQQMVGGSAQHQYAVLGASFGLLACIMTMACGLLTKERIKPKRAEKFSFKQFGDLFKNKPWIYITSVAGLHQFLQWIPLRSGRIYVHLLYRWRCDSRQIDYQFHGLYGNRRSDLYALRRHFACIHSLGRFQAYGFRVVVCHLLCHFGALLLHPDGRFLHLGDDRCLHSYVSRSRTLLSAPVVHVC